MGLVHSAPAPEVASFRTDPAALASGFRSAMRRLAATVSIVATRHGGVSVGMAATSVSSLTSTPPSLLLSVSHGASLHSPLLAEGRFTVNVLRVAHHPLISIFSGKLKGPERFEHGDWREIDGMPYLHDAQAVLVCTLVQNIAHADSEVIIGQIDAIRVRDSIAPLIWQDGYAAETRKLR